MCFRGRAPLGSIITEGSGSSSWMAESSWLGLLQTNFPWCPAKRPALDHQEPKDRSLEKMRHRIPALVHKLSSVIGRFICMWIPNPNLITPMCILRSFGGQSLFIGVTMAAIRSWAASLQQMIVSVQTTQCLLTTGAQKKKHIFKSKFRISSNYSTWTVGMGT